MKITKTGRGFPVINFTDRNDSGCSLQKSSIATEDCIWLGVDNADPVIMASTIIENGVGWAKYPVPEGVHFTTRMHLTIDQVKEILPHLQSFVESGEIEG